MFSRLSWEADAFPFLHQKIFPQPFWYRLLSVPVPDRTAASRLLPFLTGGGLPLPRCGALSCACSAGRPLFPGTGCCLIPIASGLRLPLHWLLSSLPRENGSASLSCHTPSSPSSPFRDLLFILQAGALPSGSDPAVVYPMLSGCPDPLFSRIRPVFFFLPSSSLRTVWSRTPLPPRCSSHPGPPVPSRLPCGSLGSYPT